MGYRDEAEHLRQRILLLEQELDVALSDSEAREEALSRLTSQNRETVVRLETERQETAAKATKLERELRALRRVETRKDGSGRERSVWHFETNAVVGLVVGLMVGFMIAQVDWELSVVLISVLIGAGALVIGDGLRRRRIPPKVRVSLDDKSAPSKEGRDRKRGRLREERERFFNRDKSKRTERRAHKRRRSSKRR